MYYHKREDGTVEADIPVTYEMYGNVRLVFESEEEMWEKIKDPVFVEGMSLADDPYYVDGTYEINFDMLGNGPESEGEAD